MLLFLVPARIFASIISDKYFPKPEEMNAIATPLEEVSSSEWN